MQKVCLSYRCADMDREIPALMGVSKAILENVIFVHQDEANWPLQWQCFSCTTGRLIIKANYNTYNKVNQYTKALEVIKKLHKEQAQEIKLSQKDLEKLQLLKDAAYKLRQSITQDQEESEVLGSKIHGLEQNVKDVDTKLRQNEATIKELRKLQDQVSTKTAERSTLFQEQEKRYKDLREENDDSDEDLREWKDKFHVTIASLEDKIQKLTREIKDIETKSSVSQEQIEDCMKKVSKLQTEAESHMSLKKERDDKVKKLYEEHNLGSLSRAPFSNEVASNYIIRIKSRLKDLYDDLEEKK
ncbi:hypothetical protein Tco_0277462, partial [Tanacetum coccineum]